MDLLRFADNAALTPISELRQTAKKRAKKSNEKLSSALDAIAKELAYPRWDALIASCWTVHPPKSAHNAHPECYLVVQKSDEQHIAVQLMLTEHGKPAAQDLALAVYDWTDNGVRHRLLYLSNSHLDGRTLDLPDDDLVQLSEATTLQSKLRALVPIAKTSADKIPLMIGRPITGRKGLDELMADRDIPTGGAIKIAAEIPNSKQRFEATVSIRETRQDLLDWLKPSEVPGLYEFKIQKDGSIIARRSKFETTDAAEKALKRAVRILAFLSWTGLDYPRGRMHSLASDDARRIGRNGLYDHYHILRDRVSGATVILNQPYSGHHDIRSKGLLNLLTPDSITAEAPRFTSLHGTSRVLFHALRSSGIDLEAIVQGAIDASWILRHTDFTKSEPAARSPKKESKPKKEEPAGFLSPIGHIHIDHTQVPIDEKWLIFSKVPDEEHLVKPYWRNKMKAFEGKELLSWDLWDMYRAEGVLIDDVIEKLRACPLDSDIWGFFHIFDLAELTQAECFRRGVIAGEIYLGRAFFEREEGNFWALIQTRPYMRALILLYRSLVKMERPADALPIGRWMLRLCPNDNMGIGYTIEQVEAAIDSPTLASRLAQSFAKEDASVE